MDDLTLTEACAAFKAFSKSISAKAQCSVSLSTNYGVKAIHALVKPGGYEDDTTFFLHADTFRDLLEQCEAKWVEHSDLFAANTIRRMALAIITITADQGECSDAALRAEFDASEITRYGERACAQATEMASNGPFSIVTLSGANDAEAA